MIEFEWHKDGNYVQVVKRSNKTETTPIVKEIAVRMDNLRSCHPYDENLLAFFLEKLSEKKVHDKLD